MSIFDSLFRRHMFLGFPRPPGPEDHYIKLGELLFVSRKNAVYKGLAATHLPGCDIDRMEKELTDIITEKIISLATKAGHNAIVLDDFDTAYVSHNWLHCNISFINQEVKKDCQKYGDIGWMFNPTMTSIRKLLHSSQLTTYNWSKETISIKSTPGLSP